MATAPRWIAWRCAREGGLIEADAKGGVWWKGGVVMAAWGDMIGMFPRATRG